MDKPDLSGMTTNERLFALGVLEQFNTVCERGDLVTVRRLLELAEVDEPSIAATLSRVSNSV